MNDITAQNVNTKVTTGHVKSVRGSIVDVVFQGQLPQINQMLLAGQEPQIVLEVASYLNETDVRCIAFHTTQGLERNAPVINTETFLSVPVGESILGRMINVFGEAIDGKPPIDTTKVRSIHQTPPQLSQRSVSSDVFETGIKVIDLLTPLERGG